MSLDNLPKLIFLNDNHGGYLNHAIDLYLLEPFQIYTIQHSGSILDTDAKDIQQYLDALKDQSIDSFIILNFDLFSPLLKDLSENLLDAEIIEKNINHSVDSYFYFIQMIKNLGFNNITVASSAPLDLSHTHKDNLQLFNNLMISINTALNNKCALEKIQFIDLFNNFMDANKQQIKSHLIDIKSNGQLNLNNAAIIFAKEVNKVMFNQLKEFLKPPVQFVATHETFIKKLISPSRSLNEDQYIKIHRGDVVDFTIIKENQGSFFLSKAIVNGELLDPSYRFAFIKHFVKM